MSSIAVLMALSGGLATPAWGCYSCYGNYGWSYPYYGPGWYSCYPAAGSTNSGKGSGKNEQGGDTVTAEEQKWLQELLKSAEDRADLEKRWRGATHKERRQFYQENRPGKGKGDTEEDTDQQVRVSGPMGPRARITVRLPESALLFVNAVPCPLTAATRSFDTPRLEVGRSYEYTLRAEVVRAGQTHSETRRVTFQAGKTAAVDFGDLQAPTVVAAKTGSRARITVRLPAEARLFVNDVLCTLGSETRSFQTAELPAGRRYAYTFKAEMARAGQAHTETRRVVFEGGQEVRVDFRERSVIQTAER
jgi:uncharacterized protein (TIGR03000 family)